nr:uncharacterized protein LOC119173546 isoform X3 [Rhipicephalus microplus]
MSEDHNDHDECNEIQDIPEIELIIKASTIDGRRKGACLFCQEYFMDLYLLAELKTISLKKFKLMLTRRDEQSKKSLLNQLSNIDAHLRKGGYRFLTGDTMCCFDCELMPRLQHIRVAGDWVRRNPDIPATHVSGEAPGRSWSATTGDQRWAMKLQVTTICPREPADSRHGSHMGECLAFPLREPGSKGGSILVLIVNFAETLSLAVSGSDFWK